MFTCANCNIVACATEDKANMPLNCPMRNQEVMLEYYQAYHLPENHEFYVTCSAIEAEGYCQWPRLKETIVLCKKMNYKKIGLAFCKGLHKEARIVTDLLRKNGFDVVSVICKTGGISKTEVGIAEEDQIRKGKAFEPMCNPIAQAKLLNSQNTEFNIALGLCVGHDSMFYKYSDALVTTLVAKDRVLAHNPCGAIYQADGYFKTRID